MSSEKKLQPGLQVILLSQGMRLKTQMNDTGGPFDIFTNTKLAMMALFTPHNMSKCKIKCQ